MRERRWAAPVVVLVLALVAAACGGGGASPADDSPAGQVTAMLRERATRLAAGDVAGYLEAAGPEAEAHERTLAEGAASAPVSYANVTFDPTGGGKSTATSFRDAAVEVVFRYEGLPEENLFRFSLVYDLERTGGSWVVTRSVLADTDHRVPIWATGPVESERSEHFLALYRPGLPRAAEALEAAEEARRGLDERLDLVESDPVHLVLLAGSEEEYAEFKGEPTDEGELAAAGFLFSSIYRPEQRHMIVKAARLVDEDAASTLDGGDQAPPTLVFQHELAHLALTRHDGPYTPGWVNEGAAMYLADERRVSSWRLGLDRGLFDDVSIAGMGSEGLADGIEYAYANAAVLALIDDVGAERFFEFYTSFLPLIPAPEFEADPTAVTLAQRYDLTVPELDERTRAYMDEAVSAR